MPLALTPRLSIVIPLVVLTLVVGGELYAESQQIPWPLYLSGQVDGLVPRLASIIWELAYVYWVLARCSFLLGQWGASVIYRHGSTSGWLVIGWMREAVIVVVLTFGSAIAAAVTRLMTQGWDVASDAVYVSQLATNSVLAALQLQLNFIMIVTVALWSRRSNVSILLLAASATLATVRSVVVTPFQNFGILLADAWALWAISLIIVGGAIIVVTTLTEGRLQHDRSGD